MTGGGDLFGMFNDTPQARSLIQYLLTAEAQQIWVERGGFISANKGVSLDAYPDESSRPSAEILANAETFRFDGSDLMPNAMNKAFFQGDRRVRPATRVIWTPSSRTSTRSRRTPIASRPRDRRAAAGRPVAAPHRIGGLGVLEVLIGNRLVAAILVVIAVPLVLVGYILLDRGDPAARCRDGSAPGLRPWLWLAPALAFLGVFLVYPTIATIIRSFMNQKGDQFIGLDNYGWFFSQTDTLIAIRNNAVWVILLPRPGGRPRAAHRRPGRPGPLRGRRQVHRVPADGHQLRRRRRDLAVHVRAPAGGRDAQRGDLGRRRRTRRLAPGPTAGTTSS